MIAAPVAALAGRRIDEAEAEQVRFPLERASAVKRRIAELIEREHVHVLVCSAACGADLLGLQAALECGIRSRIVLPYAPEDFRRTSVEDRPGDWGAIYDPIIAAAERTGDLIVLPGRVGDESAFKAATRAIVYEASAVVAPGPRLAIIVWEGQPREGSDATEDFRQLAIGEGFAQRTILTAPS
jgi:hypothetical protein